MRIVALDVANVKRIRAIHLEPGDSSTVILGGRNAQGKSSVLDAIQMALSGGRSIPEDPVRHGAKKAFVVADLGELVVERTITKKRTTLTVRNADGVEQRSPQAILDKLCAKLAFDPLAFSLMEPRKQNETLRELLGLDFAALDAEREKAYAERQAVNREAKQESARAAGIKLPPALPKERVTIASLIERMQEASDARARRSQQAQDLAEARSDADTAEREMTRARAALAAAKLAADEAQTAYDAAVFERDRVEALPPVEVPDVASIEYQIAKAEETNRAIELRAQRDAHELRAESLAEVADGLTSRIDGIDEQKAKAIAEAPFPVKGLALGENGPEFNGVPLSQASGAERLRVSVAIGLALNPELKVLLVRDASLLDDESLAMVAEMATEAGAQVWLERVGDGDAAAVIIEDGQLLEGEA